jgi:hypothetical protein
LLRLLARAFWKVLQCLYLVHSPYYTPYVLSKGNVSTLSFQKDSIQCLYTHTQRKVLHIQSLDIVNTPGADFEFFFLVRPRFWGNEVIRRWCNGI